MSLISHVNVSADHLPNAAALTAVQQLIQCGVENKKIMSNYSLKGHRQGGTTTCPGDKLYQEITTWPHWTNGISN
jgi:N-acetylmuramoyl-L-alanine amidase